MPHGEGLSISNFSPPSYLKKKHGEGDPGSGARWEANLDVVMIVRDKKIVMEVVALISLTWQPLPDISGEFDK